MAPIPADLMFVDVVVDPAGLAHKLGSPPPPDPDPDPVRRHRPVQTPDRWTAKCAPKGDRYQPLSAYTATRRGAEACPAKRCFGPNRARSVNEAGPS